MRTDVKTQLIDPSKSKIHKLDYKKYINRIKDRNSGGINKKLIFIPIFGIIYAIAYSILVFSGRRSEFKIQMWLALIFASYQWLIILTLAFLWLCFIYLKV